MKVTEPRLNTLIDNLNTLICEDSLLTRQERETLVLAVAAIGAMKGRVSMKKDEVPARGRRENQKKKTASLIRGSREPVTNGRKKKRTYCMMRSNRSRMRRSARIFSGFPRNWAERLSVLLSR